ncbi:MAG: energy-coupling factor transporter transmembrane protein EcfT [Clostridia bacterium]|nr:energy-coupling factor transporter transmembrane protein EcfT [Clostridia bacterium]MBQ5837763.1 energy-coupling factor transporter transmembrane protein EcfT [Clostridia bacterium]
MLKDVTFGQYYPGNSLLHRTDPRIKLLILVEYLILVLVAGSELAAAVSLMFTVFLIAVSGVRFSILIKSVKPLLFVLIFTAVINLFFTTGESEPLVDWKFITIYKEGIRNAVMMLLRLLSLVLGSSVLISFTTSPLELTDAIESVLSPLKVIRVPVHEFAMMMSIALRFIPTLIEETNKIISAQKARCADFESGNVLKRVKALIPILIPLFVSAVRRAEELADAMECRCYHGGEGRTKLKVMKSCARDYIFLTFTTLLTVGIFFLNNITVSGIVELCKDIF